MKKHSLLRTAIYLVIFCSFLNQGKSQTLIHNFEFNNSLNDTKNTGISLTSVNTATSSFQSNPNGWMWTQTSSPGGGLELLTDKLTDPTSYSIGFRISYAQTGPYWKKILSFKGPSDDNGFYFYNGSLQFYPTADLSSSTYSPNTFYDFVMTRNSAGLVKVFIVESNGTVNQVFSIQDNLSTTIPRLVLGNYEFRFFMDDLATNSEFTSGGTVRSIRLWDAPLSQAQIANALSPCPNDPNNDIDGDGICGDVDNCPTTFNPAQTDDDCDGVGNVCDVCPGGDDTVDADGDGNPDCAVFPGLGQVDPSWLCGKNNSKVSLCHIPPGNTSNVQQLCLSPNAVQAHLNHGCYVGPCVSCGTNKTDVAIDETWAFELFPNPASDNVNIQLLHLEATTTLEIISVNGAVLYTETFEESNTETTVNLSANGMTNGVYIIRVISGSDVQTKRLIVTQ